MAKVTFDKNGLAKMAGTLTIYNFNALSGEFIGASEEYLAQGVGLPGNSCAAVPPDIKAGFVTIYRDGRWLVIPDHRGETVYTIADGSPVKIAAPGDYPAGTTPLQPVTPYDKWDGDKWVKDVETEHAAEVIAAEKEKNSRIAEANSVSAAWQAQLLLGIITDSDKKRLTAWMAYVQKVQYVDVLSAPYVTWPDRPV